MRLVSAMWAFKPVFLANPDMPAGVTRLAGVVRSNLIDRNAGLDRLVPDELFELVERPVVPILSGVGFRVLARLRRAHARQVLQADSSLSFRRHRHQILRQAMVDVADGPAFPGLQLLHRAKFAGGLQSLSSFCRRPADMPDASSLTKHHRPVRRCRHDRHVLSAVHANPAPRVSRVGSLHRHRKTRIPDLATRLPELDRAGLGRAIQQPPKSPLPAGFSIFSP